MAELSIKVKATPDVTKQDFDTELSKIKTAYESKPLKIKIGINRTQLRSDISEAIRSINSGSLGIGKIKLETMIDTNKLSSQLKTALKAVSVSPLVSNGTDTGLDISTEMVAKLNRNLQGLNVPDSLRTEFTSINNELQSIIQSGSMTSQKFVEITGKVANLTAQIRAMGQVSDLDKLTSKYNSYSQFVSKVQENTKRGFSSQGLDDAQILLNDIDAQGIEHSAAKIEELGGVIGNLRNEFSQWTTEQTVFRSINSSAEALANLNTKIGQYIENNPRLVEARSTFRELLNLQAKTANGTISKEAASAQYAELVNQFQQAGVQADSLAVKLKNLFSQHLNTAIVMAGIHAIQQGLQMVLQNVKDIDAAMTELRKVTNESAGTYAQFMSDAGSRAQNIGATVKDTISATADYARLGYNLEQASKLADTSLIGKNVMDGVTDIDTASQDIISTLKAFDIEAENSISIVDKFNAVGNNFAISSGGVGEALKRSASAMAEANNTIDESIGLIVAANDVVQDPEIVGTSLKTLSLRLRGAKTELEEAGEDVDGMCETTAELRSQLLALTNQKVDIMIDDNTFKSTYQIIKEMSAAWDSMTDIDQAAALELMGGKRQANVLSAMIQNFEDAEAAAQTASTSTGSALSENEVYLDSIAGKTAQMQAAFEAFSTTVLDSGLVKGFLDIATAVTQAADGLTKFAGTGTILSGLLGGVLGGINKGKHSKWNISILCPFTTDSDVERVA